MCESNVESDARRNNFKCEKCSFEETETEAERQGQINFYLIWPRLYLNFIRLPLFFPLRLSERARTRLCAWASAEHQCIFWDMKLGVFFLLLFSLLLQYCFTLFEHNFFHWSFEGIRKRNETMRIFNGGQTWRIYMIEFTFSVLNPFVLILFFLDELL